MNILITGVAGAGKTTISKELKRLGYTAYDTDSIKNLSAWIELATGKPNPNFVEESSEDWVDKYDWLWDEKVLHELLGKSGQGLVFFCGSSGNQEQFYALFDKIFLLEMNNQLLSQRILHSHREHDYGKRPGELEVILGYYKGFQDRAKLAGAIVIDAGESLNEIVAKITSNTKVV